MSSVLGLWALLTASHAMGPSLQEDTGGFDLPVQSIGRPSSRSNPCPVPRRDEWTQLPDSSGLFRRWAPDRAWGTPEMIDVLVTAAEELAWAFPSADPLAVGDISRFGGGRLDGHISHRSGVDADIGLYYDEGRQSPLGLTEIHPRDFDPETNWVLIDSLLMSGRVDRILLDQSLITILRRYLYQEEILSIEEIDAIFLTSRDYADRSWRVRTGVVHHARNHSSHLHLRVLCER